MQLIFPLGKTVTISVGRKGLVCAAPQSTFISECHPRKSSTGTFIVRYHLLGRYGNKNGDYAGRVEIRPAFRRNAPTVPVTICPAVIMGSVSSQLAAQER